MRSKRTGEARTEPLAGYGTPIGKRRFAHIKKKVNFMKTVVVNGENLKIEDVCGVAYENNQVRICDDNKFFHMISLI